jgi:bifunctional pyridoxal-dependent enzyme with beta-cystathionase and maltose regulon repressor activities
MTTYTSSQSTSFNLPSVAHVKVVIGHMIKRHQTQRILNALDNEQRRDLGFTIFEHSAKPLPSQLW